MSDRSANSTEGDFSGRRSRRAGTVVKPSRLLIDASYTLGSGKTSGIERVVNNLRLGLGRTSLTAGVPTSTVMTFGGAFYEVGAAELRRIESVARAQSDILGCLPSAYSNVVGPIVRGVGSPKFAKWLMPERGHLGIFKLPHRFLTKHVRRQVCRPGLKLDAGPGDVIVLPDAYWTRMDVWQAAAAARERGAFVVSVVYDLIPLTHPEFVGRKRTERFRDYLKQLAVHSDLILTISETVKKQVVEALPELVGESDYCREVNAFPLGAELAPPPGKPRDSILSYFGPLRTENPYLTVAAFDPRKNHRYLLDAFERLWEQDPNRKLCLVGRVGSRCEDVVQRIKQHPRLGKELLVFHDLSDAELQHCYRHCRGVIFPSIVEGFGLPIVEAVWQGQRTFVSDTPIHREVGGNHCVYFDLGDSRTLVDCLLSDESYPLPSLQSSDSRPLSWPECIEVFARLCLSGYSGRVETGARAAILPFAKSA